jgi:hypothetical protein
VHCYATCLPVTGTRALYLTERHRRYAARIFQNSVAVQRCCAKLGMGAGLPRRRRRHDAAEQVQQEPRTAHTPQVCGRHGTKEERASWQRGGEGRGGDDDVAAEEVWEGESDEVAAQGQGVVRSGRERRPASRAAPLAGRLGVGHGCALLLSAHWSGRVRCDVCNVDQHSAHFSCRGHALASGPRRSSPNKPPRRKVSSLFCFRRFSLTAVGLVCVWWLGHTRERSKVLVCTRRYHGGVQHPAARSMREESSASPAAEDVAAPRRQRAAVSHRERRGFQPLINCNMRRSDGIHRPRNPGHRATPCASVRLVAGCAASRHV